MSTRKIFRRKANDVREAGKIWRVERDQVSQSMSIHQRDQAGVVGLFAANIVLLR
jgi:hypothetical protein